MDLARALDSLSLQTDSEETGEEDEDDDDDDDDDADSTDILETEV